MPRDFRKMFRFAMLGFAVTAMFVAYQLITDPQVSPSRDHIVMVAFIFLCPPSLLSIPFVDAEVGTSGFYFLWTLIGIVNAALYAAIRTVIVDRKKSAD